MFFHSFHYALRTLLRRKDQLFWTFAFPLVLGVMFHFAFSGLDADEQFAPIPVAVVYEETSMAYETFSANYIAENPIRMMLSSLSEEGSDQFLAITEASPEEALNLLEQKKVVGILYAGDTLRLAVSANDQSNPLNQSILNAFVEQFHLYYDGIAQIAVTHPENLPIVLSEFTKETSYLTEQSTGVADLSQQLSYFYNLIAMSCLFAAMIGNTLTVHYQANLSALGARKHVSPLHHFIGLSGELSAALLFEFSTILIGIAFYSGALGVNFGTQTGYTILAALIGCLCSISLGFFVGSFGTFTENTKFAILMAVSMSCSVLSGLMIGNMRIYVEKFCPVINRINPAALISDMFYSLAIYPSHERFWQNALTLLLFSALFIAGGCTMIRRKKYANL